MNHSKKQTTERRISATLRITLVVLLLLLNIASVVFLAFFLEETSAIAYAIMELAAILVAINIQSSQQSPSYKMAWTLLVVAVPVAGIILYVLWGGNIQSKRLTLLPIKAPAISPALRARSQHNRERLAEEYPGWRRCVQILERRDFFLYHATDATYFPTGVLFFQDARRRMEQAERFVFMEYFILAEGQLWNQILSVLEEKARQGVEIKIIFDDFGNITRLQQGMLQRMQDAGIAVQVFNPVHRYVNRLYFNYRDHRKILCIDGQYAYTGGLNVADEYVGYIIRFGEWKDTGLRLDGPGAWGLTVQFIHMWEMLGGTLDKNHDFYRPLEERAGQGWCQPFGDGPINNPDSPAEEVYLHCITNARRYIWITTPYLAVEDSMVQALCAAAEGGVDVRLCLPGIPDHKYTYIVAKSYYEQLLSHGVRIYEFTPGLLHAKSFVVDGEAALVGTINMDYRSFQLHYEDGVMLYGVPAIEDIRADIETVITRSAPIELAAWRNRPWKRRILEKFLRVFSIWM